MPSDDVTTDEIATAIGRVDGALLAAERAHAPSVTVGAHDLHLVMRWTATLARREYARIAGRAYNPDPTPDPAAARGAEGDA